MSFSKFRTLGAIASAIALTILAPIGASAASPSAADDSGAVTDFSEPTPGDDLAPAVAEGLAEAGIEGDVTVQEAPDGTMLYIDGDGDWLITPEEHGVSPMAGDFTVGVCTGTFHMPRKDGSALEWGAQNSCSGTSSWYLHRIHVTLRQTCAEAWCIQYEDLWRYQSPSSENYARVVNVTADASCENDNTKRYDLVVIVTAKSVQYRFNSRPVDVDCDVHPGPGGV